MEASSSIRRSKKWPSTSHRKDGNENVRTLEIDPRLPSLHFGPARDCSEQNNVCHQPYTKLREIRNPETAHRTLNGSNWRAATRTATDAWTSTSVDGQAHTSMRRGCLAITEAERACAVVDSLFPSRESDPSAVEKSERETQWRTGLCQGLGHSQIVHTGAWAAVSYGARDRARI